MQIYYFAVFLKYHCPYEMYGVIGDERTIWRYLSVTRSLKIWEQIIRWPKRGQKDNQLSKEHYTEN